MLSNVLAKIKLTYKIVESLYIEIFYTESRAIHSIYS